MPYLYHSSHKLKIQNFVLFYPDIEKHKDIFSLIEHYNFQYSDFVKANLKSSRKCCILK